MSRYLRNSAICLECNKEIESTHRHDFQSCGCPNNLHVDGGLDYLKRGARNIGKIKDTSIERNEPQKFVKGDILEDLADGTHYLLVEVDAPNQMYEFKVLHTHKVFKSYMEGKNKWYSFYMANRDLQKKA